MAEVWVSRIADHRASGQTVVAWCERHQVTPKQFYYWMRKLNKADRQMPAASGPKWVALSVAEAAVEAPPVVVKVGSIVVEVRGGFEPSVPSPMSLGR